MWDSAFSSPKRQDNRKKAGKMEQDALKQWLEKRQQSKTEPDDDFLTMLAEIFRGQEP